MIFVVRNESPQRSVSIKPTLTTSPSRPHTSYHLKTSRLAEVPKSIPGKIEVFIIIILIKMLVH